MAEKIVDPSRRRDIPRAARAAAVADLALAAGHRAAARRRRRTPYWGGEGFGEMPPKRQRSAAGPSGEAPVNSLDDGCLMHIFSFLSPIPGSIRS
jgi:hypothetical protein